MTNRRVLALRRESLAELTSDELARFAGGTLDEVNERLEALYWKLSIHQHCTWTCI